MKKFAASVLVIFIILLTTQLVRHAYERIFFTQESVLDRYTKAKSDITINSSLSLKELSMIYADAEKRIRVLESGKGRKKLAQYDSDDPYEKKNMIKEMITVREKDNRMLAEIIFYWVSGLILIACGSLAFLKFNQWTGAALAVSGFTAMTWKLGPLFFMNGTVPDSTMILTVKLICTLITLGVLIAYWYFTRDYHER